MALSTIIKQTCKVCGKIAVEKSRFVLGNTKMITLECGHITYDESLNSELSIESCLNNTTLRPYQVEAVRFLENANARAILGDEQGLGKTIEVLALIKLHRDELLPCIYVCPTTIKLQVHHEILDKCGTAGFLTQVISSGKELAAPGFDIYITTYDLIKNEHCFDLVKDKIKLVIFDEAQRIKNHLSGRAKAAQKLAKDLEHVIPMSGTMIENHAGEYFTALNLVRPRLFPQYITYIERDCDSYNNGWGYKVGGLRNPQAFREKTKDFIIRRTKAEVLKDLPEKQRNFQYVELDPKVNKAYAEALQELEELIYSDGDSNDSFAAMSSKIAIMSKMRRITGIGKVQTVTDMATDFIMSNDRKLTIFTHHHTVMGLLENNLNSYMVDGGFSKCLTLRSEMNDEVRHRVVQDFEHNDNRILIASTQSAGAGLNLQFCSDAIMMERQWNPKKEEQPEDRFHRFGQKNVVLITYPIALSTIDEYTSKLIEMKRGYVDSTLDGVEMKWDENKFLNELAEMLVTKGKKEWTI